MAAPRLFVRTTLLVQAWQLVDFGGRFGRTDWQPSAGGVPHHAASSPPGVGEREVAPPASAAGGAAGRAAQPGQGQEVEVVVRELQQLHKAVRRLQSENETLRKQLREFKRKSARRR